MNTWIIITPVFIRWSMMVTLIDEKNKNDSKEKKQSLFLPMGVEWWWRLTLKLLQLNNGCCCCCLSRMLSIEKLSFFWLLGSCSTTIVFALLFVVEWKGKMVCSSIDPFGLNWFLLVNKNKSQLLIDNFCFLSSKPVR